MRGVVYFIALVVLGTGALLVAVASDFPMPARVGLSVFTIAIAAVTVLLVHQPIGRLSISAAILVVLSFILPPMLIASTPTSCIGHIGPPPCDPAMNFHLGLRVGSMAVIAAVALVAAVVGTVRSS